MSIQLTTGQMLQVLHNEGHPAASTLTDIAVKFANSLALLITCADHNPPEFTELWGDEIMVGFNGTGPIPEALRGFDDEGWEP